MKSLILVLTLLNSVMAAAQDVCLNEEEYRLYNLIMEYRKSRKLPVIPFSSKLTKVAQAHVKDLNANFDYENRGDCNPHSWSDKGNWSPCCYTPDHKQSKCMWDKPREIAGYDGDGFEIAYWNSEHATALEGLELWKKSAGHNPVIINSGTWEKHPWNAIGIGVSGKYAVVWFGEVPDKSKINMCE